VEIVGINIMASRDLVRSLFSLVYRLGFNDCGFPMRDVSKFSFSSEPPAVEYERSNHLVGSDEDITDSKSPTLDCLSESDIAEFVLGVSRPCDNMGEELTTWLDDDTRAEEEPE
jgi:hypothetical protein